MDREVILFTKKFPFDKGEEFIENEIKILNERFSRIVIIATALSKTSVITRKVQENVSIYKINDIQNNIIRYVLYIICGFFYLTDSVVRNEIIHTKGLKAKIGVLYMSARCFRLVRKINKSKLIKKDIDCDNCIYYSYWFNDLPFVCINLKNKLHKKNIKIISRAHGYDLYDYRNITNVIPFRKYVLENIDHVFTCSDDGCQYLKERYPMYDQKISYSYLGTIDNGLGNTEIHDSYNIVTCSAIIKLKRLNLLVEALIELEKNLENEKIIWYCIGDGPLLDEIKEQSSKLRKIKIIFKGHINNKDVISFYKNNPVDLFINVSETEGLPVSIMEAISFGIPVLATDVGGTREIVKNELTGKLIPSTVSIQELKLHIHNMLKHKYDRVKIRRYWNEHFNSVKNYNDFVNSIISYYK